MSDSTGAQKLEQAIASARAGAHAEARAALIAYLGQHPADADAWFWLACVTESPWEAWSSLRKVLELAPAYPQAQDGLAWVRGEIDAGRCLRPMSVPYVPALPATVPLAAEPIPAAVPVLHRRLPPALGALLIFVLIGGLAATIWFGLLANRTPALSEAPAATLTATAAPTPTRTPLPATPKSPVAVSWEEAWEKGDWVTAINLLEKLAAQEPTNAAWRSRLFEAHVRLGNQFADNNQVKESLAQYDIALSLRPYDSELQQERGVASRYLAALERYQAGDWVAAAEALQLVYQQEGEYRDTRELLYSAHYNLGLSYQAAGRLDDAERELLAAQPLAQDPLDVTTRLAQVRQLKTPPTPTPSPKRIEVDLSEQRFYAYNGDQLVFKFVTSTGNNDSPTAPGSYRILDKIPMAYASTWNLKMPYWLGIYWSGTLENGIHALPILSNGKILWDGFLGQRVSFGCVILSNQDAKTIYDWVDIGTPVIVRQ